MRQKGGTWELHNGWRQPGCWAWAKRRDDLPVVEPVSLLLLQTIRRMVPRLAAAALPVHRPARCSALQGACAGVHFVMPPWLPCPAQQPAVTLRSTGQDLGGVELLGVQHRNHRPASAPMNWWLGWPRSQIKTRGSPSWHVTTRRGPAHVFCLYFVPVTR